MSKKDETVILSNKNAEFKITRFNKKIISVFSDHYEILEDLGRGGEARVYKAREKTLDRIVALKVFNQGGDLSDKITLKNQAKISAGLKHENLILIHKFSSIEEYVFIEMEYLNGGTLNNLIHKHGFLKEELVLSIIKDVFKGLSEVHKNNVIHRDIKSSNIMFEYTNSKKLRSVLMDFGIARSVTGTIYTATGALKGTPQYMSPEICQGGKADVRSDLYSMGIMLYEMLTGRFPFDAEQPLSVLHMHIHNELESPKIINPKISDDLEKVIFRLLAKNPNDRYQSCGEVLDDLQRMEIENKTKPENADKQPSSVTENAIEKNIIEEKSSNLQYKVSLITFILVLLASIFIYMKVNYPYIFRANKMVYVNGGTFKMGNSLSTSYDDEVPVHNVMLRPFYISNHEVTRNEYRRLTRDTNSNFYIFENERWVKDDSKNWQNWPNNNLRNTGNDPVVGVSFYDAIEYCNKLSKMQGFKPCYYISGKKVTCDWKSNGYRLPTEAEWEYVAKKGNNNKDKIFKLRNQAWYSENSNGSTQPVKGKSANALGIFDLYGNVSEWCWDYYNSETYKNNGNVKNPTGPKAGQKRALRGGSWGNYDSELRPSNRGKSDPSNAFWDVGFRVVRNVR